MTYEKLLDINEERIFDSSGKQIWVHGDKQERVPSYWSKTVTIYNRKVDTTNGIVRWYKTVLQNCFYATFADASKRGGGFRAYSSDERAQHEVPKVTVRIPYQKKYQSPSNWIPQDGFTAQPDDIIVLGNCNEVISDTKGHRVNEILDKYGLDAMVVKKVRDNVSTSDYIKHIHIEGY